MLLRTGIAQAVESAKKADVAIVCVGDSAEAVGYDGSVSHFAGSILLWLIQQYFSSLST